MLKEGGKDLERARKRDRVVDDQMHHDERQKCEKKERNEARKDGERQENENLLEWKKERINERVTAPNTAI